MPRIARVVVPGIPHHVTQRGNRRQRVFFGDDDYHTYINLLSDHCRRCGVEVWAYCLMPNHVHLVMIPSHVDGLHQSLARTHLRYTRAINFREGWRGFLWQGRFASFPMDEPHLLAAVRYIELNPVRAGLCDAPEEWPWSSARAHLDGVDDILVTVPPMQHRVDSWATYLSEKCNVDEQETIQQHARTGRPLGSEEFIEKLERVTERKLKKRRAGRPRKPRN